MTLIAAFRCDIEGEQGVIICADSQESFGEYRMTVEKIWPRETPLYDVCFAGSGHIGDLIDALGNAIEREVGRWDQSYCEEEARRLLENEIVLFNSRQVEAYPALPDEKVIQFIVCLRVQETGAIYLWKVSGSTIEPISDHDLIGWGEPLYKYEMKRLYRNVTDKTTAMTLGLHLLSLGKATARSIDKPFHIIGVSPTLGMWTEPEDVIEELEAKVRGVNETLSRLITLAPDVQATEDRFQDALRLFEQEILGLREHTKSVSASASPSPSISYSDSLFRFRNPHTVTVEPLVPKDQLQNPNRSALEAAVEIVETYCAQENEDESDI